MKRRLAITVAGALTALSAPAQAQQSGPFCDLTRIFAGAVGPWPDGVRKVDGLAMSQRVEAFARRSLAPKAGQTITCVVADGSTNNPNKLLYDNAQRAIAFNAYESAVGTTVDVVGQIVATRAQPVSLPLLPNVPRGVWRLFSAPLPEAFTAASISGFGFPPVGATLPMTAAPPGPPGVPRAAVIPFEGASGRPVRWADRTMMSLATDVSEGRKPNRILNFGLSWTAPRHINFTAPFRPRDTARPLADVAVVMTGRIAAPYGRGWKRFETPQGGSVENEVEIYMLEVVPTSIALVDRASGRVLRRQQIGAAGEFAASGGPALN